jgi:hypothetical protein
MIETSTGKSTLLDGRTVNRKFLGAPPRQDSHMRLEASDDPDALEEPRAARPLLISSQILMASVDAYRFACEARADPPAKSDSSGL